MSNFTDKQIENFKDFEDVRNSGVINMHNTISGCEMTGMTKDEWIFCIINYDELKKLNEGK